MCLTSMKFSSLEKVDGELHFAMQGSWSMQGYKAYQLMNIDNELFARGLIWSDTVASADPMVADQHIINQFSNIMDGSPPSKYESGWHIFRGMRAAIVFGSLNVDDFVAIFATHGKDVVASGLQSREPVDVCRLKRDLYLVGFARLSTKLPFMNKDFDVEFYRNFSTDAFDPKSLMSRFREAISVKPTIYTERVYNGNS